MMAGGENYTNFKGVNFRNTGFVRVELDGGKVGTMSVQASPDANRSWKLPDKSGIIGVTGTFVVNLPAISAETAYGTNVTVEGVRTEDGMVCTIQNTTTTAITSRGFAILGGCKTGNGGVNLTFLNPSSSATIYADIVLAYTIVK